MNESILRLFRHIKNKRNNFNLRSKVKGTTYYMISNHGIAVIEKPYWPKILVLMINAIIAFSLMMQHKKCENNTSVSIDIHIFHHHSKV